MTDMLLVQPGNYCAPQDYKPFYWVYKHLADHGYPLGGLHKNYLRISFDRDRFDEWNVQEGEWYIHTINDKGLVTDTVVQSGRWQLDRPR